MKSKFAASFVLEALLQFINRIFFLLNEFTFVLSDPMHTMEKNEVQIANLTFILEGEGYQHNYLYKEIVKI